MEHCRWLRDGYNARKAPDSFVKDLRLIDPRLVVRWSDEKSYWQIWIEDSRAPLTLRFLFRVEDDDGAPRELDHRVFEYLYAMDTWRGEGKKEWFREYKAEKEVEKARENHGYSAVISNLAAEVAEAMRGA